MCQDLNKAREIDVRPGGDILYSSMIKKRICSVFSFENTKIQKNLLSYV